MDLHVQKKRLMTMLIVDGVAAVAAIGAGVGAFAYSIGWLVWAFVAALVVGFGAQIWFIAGFRPAKQGA